VFYGKVFNHAIGPDYVITQGAFTWVISRPDGRQVTLTGQLEELKNGEFSYQLRVPHQALSAGLEVATNAVPLAAQPAACSHLQILIDGVPARVVAPGSTLFSVGQPIRASTYRLDLESFNPLADTDGDGIPDAWADRFNVDDALADPDGDGWNNRTEFRLGSRPDHDDRVPALATKELLVYADGTTGLRLRALDSDSTAVNLLYTLATPPAIGTLILRNAVSGSSPSDRALVAGDSFSQADIDRGRLVFAHAGAVSASLSVSFSVSLRDEDPSHAATSATVALIFYRPAASVSVAQLRTTAGLPTSVTGVEALPVQEQQTVLNYLASRDLGYVVWDASREGRAQTMAVPSSGLTPQQYDSQYVPAFGPDRRHLLIGGNGDDDLSGGMEADVLVASAGNKRLSGGGGGDLFSILGPQGNHTIVDFHAAEGDMIDLSHAFAGSSTELSDYLQLASGAGGSVLRIDTDGVGGGFTDITVTLAGTAFQPEDLYPLVDSGRLLVGNKRLSARISLAATQPVASENGPNAGSLTLTRAGYAGSDLMVNLQISGSAVNGVDYSWIPNQVTFASGQREVVLTVTPYVDALTELTEVVDVLVQPGPGYVVGPTARAQVTIEDLAPLITIEPLEPLATKNPLRPASFLVQRAGILDRSVFLRLNIAGNAAAGTDYNTIPAYVNLAANQTSYLLEILPKSTAVLSHGAESVQITLTPNSAYKLGTPSAASVWIVEEELSFSLWQQRNFPGVTQDTVAFASADFGSTGLKNILRYAFQLDALNPQADATSAPKFQILENRLAVTFRHPAAISDVQYVVEVSDDLVTWNSSSDRVEAFVPAEAATDGQVSGFRAKRTRDEAHQQFMRVRVVYSP